MNDIYLELFCALFLRKNHFLRKLKNLLKSLENCSLLVKRGKQLKL